MKIIIALIFVSIISPKAQSGWIITGDSTEFGVIKVTRSIEENMKIEICPYLYARECKSYTSVGALEETYETIENLGQTIAAGLSHVFMAAIALLAPKAIALTPALIVSGVGISGEYVLTKLKSANIIRHADFVRIYADGFIESDNDIISFPDDRVIEILAEF